MKPNQYVKPSTYTTAVFNDTPGHEAGSIRFNTGDIRSETEAATDPSVYVAALVEAAEDYLNGDDWREAAMEATPCEFRPAGSEATGQQIITMADTGSRTTKSDSEVPTVWLMWVVKRSTKMVFRPRWWRSR
jgi:hypothetical protein